MPVKFYLDSRPDKNGEVQIRVSIVINGSRLLTSTGLKVNPEKWDPVRQKPKKGLVNRRGLTWIDISDRMRQIESHFEKIENDGLLVRRVMNQELLKEEFREAFRPDKKGSGRKSDDVSLESHFNSFMTETGRINVWTVTTHRRFKALWNHLKDWRSDLSFEDFDEKGLYDFVVFLREKLDMKNSTAAKQLSLLRRFLRWAESKGLNRMTDFRTFSPKFKNARKSVVFLERDELMKLYNFEIPKNGTVVELRRHDGTAYEKTVEVAPALEKTRDIFCFCAFTSLRYSDAQNLKWSDISGGSMTITTVKTSDTVTIELNRFAQAILKKYSGADFGGFVFPRITNQRMNVYIKVLAELCEINRPVTQTYFKGSERHDESFPKFELMGTHTARRTFICNALMLGIPAEIVMKWTGHADYSAMKPYIDVAGGAKARAMKLFDDF